MIWDINTRLFHLFLVILIIVSVISAKLEYYNIHEISGLTLFSILVFRIYWGIYGHYYSRFKNFNLSYSNVKLFLINKNVKYQGHNPLGSISIITIFCTIFFLIITGLFSTDDILYDGPLMKIFPKYSITMTKIHNLLHYFLYFIITLHILVSLYYQFLKKNKIISQMIDGKSREKDFISMEISDKKTIIGLFILLTFTLLPSLVLL